MKKTKFTLYQNTPFTDFSNMVDFGSNKSRDLFFSTHYNQKSSETNYNFIRDRLTLRVSDKLASWDWLNQVNYISFESQFEDSSMRYYAQVPEIEYLNDGTTELRFVIDGLMTFCQGDISKYAKNVKIDRQHLTSNTYSKNLIYLRTNDDYIPFNSRRYVRQDTHRFTFLMVVFLSSVDLSKDFGDADNPKLKTSSGQAYDKVVSPQNLYVIPYALYNQLMSKLSDYPWISQNITKTFLIPKEFVDTSDLENVENSKVDFNGLQKFKNDRISKDLTNLPELNHSQKELMDIFNIDDIDLLRSQYTNIELTNFQGQQVEINPEFLTKDLEIVGRINVGYSNNAYFFPTQYKTNGENFQTGMYAGTFLNNAIVFNTWDDVPMQIDNYKLSYAQSANQRNLAQNNLITGQAGNVLDKNQSLQDRLMSAVNLTSSVSVGAISGKLVDEWQFYRQQKAELADKKITAPTITTMSNTNSFAIKQGFFGVTLKYNKIDDESLKSAKRYYKHFGYQWNRTDNLESTESMSHLNYAKFSGNWIIDDRRVPQSIMEMIRIQFENGVKIWHVRDIDNAPDNPFRQDITNLNTRIL